MGVVAALGGLAAGVGPSVVQFAGAKAGGALAKKLMGDRKQDSRYDYIRGIVDNTLIQAPDFTVDEATAIKDPKTLVTGSLERPSTNSVTGQSSIFSNSDIQMPSADLQELLDISRRQNAFVTDISKSAMLTKIGNIKPKTLLGSL